MEKRVSEGVWEVARMQLASSESARAAGGQWTYPAKSDCPSEDHAVELAH